MRNCAFSAIRVEGEQKIPSKLRSIVFLISTPIGRNWMNLVVRQRSMVTPKDVQEFVVSSLPAKARWLIDGTTLDFDFTLSRSDLCPLPDGRVPSYEDDPANDLLIFGLQDFADGGGAQPWLCLRKADGWICGFDADCDDDPIFILNSSIQRFVETFLFLNQYLQQNKSLPSDSEKRLSEIDPDANATSNWTLLVDHLSHAEIDGHTE